MLDHHYLCTTTVLSADLGAANVPVDTLAGVTLLLPPAAVRKLQAGMTTRLPESDDWREEKRTRTKRSGSVVNRPIYKMDVLKEISQSS